MHFAYEGFTQNDDRRCFTFRGMEDYTAVSVFCIEVELPLFARNRVLVQEGPMFCLQLLMTANVAGPSFLERFRSYRVLEADFRPLLLEREKRAAEKAMKKTPPRPFRKALPISNIRLASSYQKH
jgi:hypothetical protein